MANSKDLILAYKENKLLEALSDKIYGHYEKRKELAEELIGLHNDGLLDLVEEFKKIQNRPNTKSDFFLLRDIIVKALPKIEAPVKQVMECIQHLMKMAGNDMSSGMVLIPYTDFCAAAPSRPIESLKQIEFSGDEYLILLAPSIVAGTRIDLPLYVRKAVNLTKHENIEVRRQAVFALGNIKYEDSTTSIDRALEALENSCSSEGDDQLLANLIHSSTNIYKCDAKNCVRIHQLLETALSKGEKISLYAAASLFGYHHEGLSDQLIIIFLKHLQSVELQHKGTIDALDSGLARLLDNDSTQQQALEFIENYFLANRSDDIADLFDSTSRVLLNDRSLLSTVITKWFLKGDIALCEAILYILKMVHGQNMELSVDGAVLLEKSPVCTIFIARKILGYLIYLPVTAASLLLSLFQYCGDESTTKELSELLFDPLLLNYPGSVKEYLETQEEKRPEDVMEIIQVSLGRLESYFDALHQAKEINELHPYQSQREAYRRQQLIVNVQINKEVNNKSIFSAICSKVILLHGKKTINYIHGPDGKTHRQVMPLQYHSAQIELPYTERFDPFGLDYNLRIFRVERLKK